MWIVASVSSMQESDKTFVINLLLAKVRQQKKMIVAMASCGIASTLLEGGRTATLFLQIAFELGPWWISSLQYYQRIWIGKIPARLQYHSLGVYHVSQTNPGCFKQDTSRPANKPIAHSRNCYYVDWRFSTDCQLFQSQLQLTNSMPKSISS